MENSQDVLSGFDILLVEIEAEIEFTNGEGAKAFETSSYEKAREILEHVGKLTAFRDRVTALRSEWIDLSETAELVEDEATKIARRNLGRLRKGQRTPEAEYMRPILEALVDMGGSGRTQDVLARVQDKMKAILGNVDYEPLTSHPGSVRWSNSAQWARNSMVKSGLMLRTSPHGTWEISQEGRAFLKEQSD